MKETRENTRENNGGAANAAESRSSNTLSPEGGSPEEGAPEEVAPCVAIIDVESTGINPSADYIIEFAVQKGLKDGGFRKAWRIKPPIPIPAEATAVHGIRDEDVADCPSFAEVAPLILRVISGSTVIVGYNVSFDISLINAELRRGGFPVPDLSTKMVVDPLQLWRKCEPRRLEDAAKRFAPGVQFDAHQAAADVYATGKVLEGMLRDFGLAHLSWQELSEFLEPEKRSWIGPTSHLVWKDGQAFIAFGKYKDTPLAKVVERSPDYLDWLMNRDFPPHVKEIARRARSVTLEELTVWIQTTYTRE